MKTKTIVTVALVAVITILAIHVVTRTTEAVRVDLTEDRLYSLTDGTRAILEKMQNDGTEPIDITLYHIPALASPIAGSTFTGSNGTNAWATSQIRWVNAKHPRHPPLRARAVTEAGDLTTAGG